MCLSPWWEPRRETLLGLPVVVWQMSGGLQKTDPMNVKRSEIVPKSSGPLRENAELPESIASYVGINTMAKEELCRECALDQVLWVTLTSACQGRTTSQQRGFPAILPLSRHEFACLSLWQKWPIPPSPLHCCSFSSFPWASPNLRTPHIPCSCSYFLKYLFPNRGLGAPVLLGRRFMVF